MHILEACLMKMKMSRDYEIRISDKLSKILRKSLKKDNIMYTAIINKIEEIRLNPDHYPNLHGRMSNLKHVHVGSSFVLLYSVDENTRTITFEDLKHHDDAYFK